jgi:hypothetical protein
LRFDIPRQEESRAVVKVKVERVKGVCDPWLAAAARELRDRWLEKVNAEPELIEVAGKYEMVVGEGKRTMAKGKSEWEGKLLGAA